MHIRQLQLTPFRNFTGLDIALSSGGVLIVGDNGRGKSNILEAISFLSLGKSVRGGRDAEAVPHDGDYFDIRGVWEHDDRQHQVRLFYSPTQGKNVFVDGVPLARVSELVSQFQTVHFAPQDVALVLRFAAQRRRLLDILLSQSNSDYLRNLQRYGRILAQRNRYLKLLGQMRADGSERGAWNAQLAEAGATIRHRRLVALAQMGPIFEGCYARFSTGSETATIDYRGASLPVLEQIPTVEQMRTELVDELGAEPRREERAGHTLRGPHRDAVGFRIDGAEAETYGSQGQLKSVLLSWKMAEAHFLEACSGQQPVLLLDDVFSELDTHRGARLLTLAGDFEQVILTSPRAPSEAVPSRYTRIELAA